MSSSNKIETSSSNSALRLAKSLLRNPVGLLGFILVAGVILLAVGAPLFAPHDPTEFNFRARLEPPSWLGGEPGFFLGTDQLGQIDCPASGNPDFRETIILH